MLVGELDVAHQWHVEIIIIGPYHGIRFVSDRTFTGFFPS